MTSNYIWIQAEPSICDLIHIFAFLNGFCHLFYLSRQEFVNAYVDYIFNTSVAPQFSAFYAGFHKVCGGKVLELFQPSELQAMIIGNTNYDWKELEKVKLTLGELHQLIW